ncbi:MAG: DUF3120 domain-containing protein [Cyanobacteria bacterium J06627_28]
MQVLQRTTPQVKDVETLQISNDSFSDQSQPRGSATFTDAHNPLNNRRPNSSRLSNIAFLSDETLPLQPNAIRFKAFAASAFLVAVPVFIQAPLVRILPEFALLTTAAWLTIGWRLLNKSNFSKANTDALASSPEEPSTPEVLIPDPSAPVFNAALWGDLIIGFSWTWLAGAIYWGWFRTDPYVHLPIEAIGLPIVVTLLLQNKAKIGNYFYLGSLLGTAITDLYFYCTGLIPYWRALMLTPEEASPILHSALLRMETYQGVGCAIVLLTLLVMLGTIPLRSRSATWWAFSGAVLSTILVDSLFFVAAIFA